MQLEHLQHELDIANSQLDRNFGRLEEAGLSAVDLAEKLAAANTKIAVLQEELALLARESKSSTAAASAHHDRNERLENALETLREQMAILKDDMGRERERLQDDNRRLRVMLADLQSKAGEEREALRVEIAQAQREAEDQFTEYQERLQAMRDERDGIDAVSDTITDAMGSNSGRSCALRKLPSTLCNATLKTPRLRQTARRFTRRLCGNRQRDWRASRAPSYLRRGL